MTSKKDEKVNFTAKFSEKRKAISTKRNNGRKLRRKGKDPKTTRTSKENYRSWLSHRKIRTDNKGNWIHTRWLKTCLDGAEKSNEQIETLAKRKATSAASTTQKTKNRKTRSMPTSLSNESSDLIKSCQNSPISTIFLCLLNLTVTWLKPFLMQVLKRRSKIKIWWNTKCWEWKLNGKMISNVYGTNQSMDD